MKMMFGKDSTFQKIACYFKMQWKFLLYVNSEENTKQREEMEWGTLKREPLEPSTNAYSTFVSE